jgi:AraC-like DNA-binding protein
VQWADIALTCGYYDQSHMVHDFHDFTGLSPANYLARRGPFINHVPERVR